MDRLDEFAGGELQTLERRVPHLRIAVRDGCLVEDELSGRNSEMQEEVQAETILGDRVALGGQVAQLIDDAMRTGCTDFAKQLEDCFTAFLNGLPKAQKRAVLLMAYDAAIRRGQPEATRPKLNRSRPPLA
jgi:hypothetical protein